MRCFEDAGAELDALKRRLAAEEADALRRGLFDRSGQSAHFKAGCVVWVMAILEDLFRRLAEEVRGEVFARCPAPDVLHPALTMALSQGAWKSASEQERSAIVRRIELVSTYVMGTDEWPESFSFHDGKTVNDQSFATVWKVLGLEGTAFGTPAQPTLLRDLAARRNRVAHGEQTVSDAGRALTFGDLARKIDQVDELVANLHIAVDDWLSRGGWRV